MKEHSGNGIKGCVLQRKNRYSKTLISVYNSQQAGFDDANKWSVVCEDHSQILGCEVLHLAKVQARYPEWCSECQKIILQRNKSH